MQSLPKTQRMDNVKAKSHDVGHASQAAQRLLPQLHIVCPLGLDAHVAVLLELSDVTYWSQGLNQWLMMGSCVRVLHCKCVVLSVLVLKVVFV